jgi:hypothetical protein
MGTNYMVLFSCKIVVVMKFHTRKKFRCQHFISSDVQWWTVSGSVRQSPLGKRAHPQWDSDLGLPARQTSGSAQGHHSARCTLWSCCKEEPTNWTAYAEAEEYVPSAVHRTCGRVAAPPLVIGLVAVTRGDRDRPTQDAAISSPNCPRVEVSRDDAQFVRFSWRKAHDSLICRCKIRFLEI